MVVGILIWAAVGLIVGAFVGRPSRRRPGCGHGRRASASSWAACSARSRRSRSPGTSRSRSGSPCCWAPRRRSPGAFAASGGIDLEALKARYIPQATIDTTKETIEWAQARIPGRRS